MSSGDHAIANDAQNENRQDLSNVLPRGAYTVIMQVRLRSELGVQAQKVLLSEYARKTCAEQGVIRCDVLFQVNKLGLAKDDFYEIWTSFTDPRSYLEHERTIHASKLRLCLDNPHGGDNSKLLTKLAHNVTLLRPVRPNLAEWVSAFDYATDDTSSVGATELSGGSMKAHQDSNRVRRSLEMLISSVGMEDVVILVARASAFSIESTRALRSECEQYLTETERSAGVVRTGLLVDKSDPYKIVLMTVHDGNDRDGACFDLELASDYITEDGWAVQRCLSVFPDKVGWEKKLSEDDQRKYLGDVLEDSFESVTSPQGGLVKYDRGDPEDPKMRLIHGAGSFESLKESIRSMTGRPADLVRAMFVCGWNESRLYPLLVQIEYDRYKDPGEIHFHFGATAYSTEIKTQDLRKAMKEVAEYRPDVIIGYGGGTVMDMAKLIARVANATENEIEEYLTTIDGAAEAEAMGIGLRVVSKPMPVVLIPTTIGSGAEMIEWCVVAARKDDGSLRRIPLYFQDVPGSVREPTEKTVIQESRLVSPSRLHGLHTSQGALQLVGLGIDALIALHERLEEQAFKFAIRGIRQAYRVIMDARREPTNATGQSRDPLVDARTFIGLALDGVGRPGVCVRICLALLDSLVDGRSSTVFRQVLTRTSIAVLQECVESKNAAGSETFKKVLQATKQVSRQDLILDMLRKAEDCDVSLLPMLGSVRRTIPESAARVALYLSGEKLSPLETYFSQEEVIERIMHRAMDQEYEL
ncbi:hypothetical protein BWQ96_07377 [Gracilariopsis chorda]|uniref:Alcohol dehydrogenase iron-type/glycerol dehydrogenase GldA domain-containing protein n=1 Tax=Gracilariopsis chorda TaxID=448386 RepID=A0A2V3IP75_9FLOR|nr:hypothetical protein BWQ96_07377 [Gracilariopsis chorda]|eukprot:PXF42930.1 hypothetical protein BWQ96_07377 [Gracilariopsis chorda]